MTSSLGMVIPGGWELWIILAIFLLLFGHRIPSMARSMGSGIVEFKKGLKEGTGDDAKSSAPKDGGSSAERKEPQDAGANKG